MNPEERARQSIDRLLTAAGWAVQDYKAAHIGAARGVALREFELNPGHGTADYLLYVDGKAAGIIEAKKQGATLTGVEVQSGKYAQGLPATLPGTDRCPSSTKAPASKRTSPTRSTPSRAPATSSPSTARIPSPTGSAPAWCRVRVSFPRKREPSVFHKSPTKPRRGTTSAPSSTAYSTCPRWPRSGPTSSSGPLRSPPSATWKPASRRTSRAR